MSEAPIDSALIVGGGLAGLCTAIALGKRGVRTTVVDHQGEMVGAAILITHRAVYAIEELGVLEPCMAAGDVIAADELSWWAHVYTPEKQRLPVREPVLEDWSLPSSIFILRPVLAEILTKRARELGADVRHHQTFESLEQRDDRVDAVLTSGERRSFDLVVGADGINSAVRARFFPEVEGPHYTGSMSFRMMFREIPDSWFRGLHVAHGGTTVTNILPGKLCYLAVNEKLERRRVEQAEAREIVRAALARHEPSEMLGEAAARLDEDINVIVGPFEWIIVPQPWHRGRVVLVGDAAHATTPNLGSAGSMAIEDAVVLGQELEDAPDLETALAGYNRRRYERTKMVVDTSVKLMNGQRGGGLTSQEQADLRVAALEKLAEPY